METKIHLWSHLAQFFLERKMFQTKVVEKIKIHVYMLKVVNNTTRYRKNVYSRY